MFDNSQKVHSEHKDIEGAVARLLIEREGRWFSFLDENGVKTSVHTSLIIEFKVNRLKTIDGQNHYFKDGVYDRLKAAMDKIYGSAEPSNGS